LNGATYKSETKFSGGGVGRNIAEGLQKLNGAVMLISAFGNDQNGDFLRKTLPDHATVGSQISDTSPTANCAVILDRSGDCKLCAGDMTIHAEITPDVIKRNEKLFIKTPLICIDSNLSIEAMETILLLAKRLHKPVFYEPTDMSLAGKPFKLDRDCYEQIKFISPNLQELRSIAVALKLSSDFDSHSQIEKEFKTVVKEQDDDFREIVELCDALQDRIDNIVVTAGSRGVVVQRRRGRNAFFNSDFIYVNDKMEEKGCRYYPGEPLDQIVNASGAGDAFAAGFIAGMLSHKPEEICVSIGLHAATSALMSTRAVPKTFFDRGHQCWSTPAVFKTLT
ncbi:CLUMA_CG011970, isoform A, partial [Clunio marinus]